MLMSFITFIGFIIFNDFKNFPKSHKLPKIKQLYTVNLVYRLKQNKKFINFMKFINFISFRCFRTPHQLERCTFLMMLVDAYWCLLVHVGACWNLLIACTCLDFFIRTKWVGYKLDKKCRKPITIIVDEALQMQTTWLCLIVTIKFASLEFMW